MGTAALDNPGDAINTFARMVACGSVGEVAEDILAPLCRYVGATSAAFIHYRASPGGMSIGRGVTFALDPASLEAYERHYHVMDPVAQAALALTTRQNARDWRETVTLWGLSEGQSLRNTSYYNEFLRPFGLGDVLGTFVPVRALSSRAVLCVGLHRQEGARPFGKAEMHRLRAIRPLVAAGLSNLALQEAVDCADYGLGLVAGVGQSVGLAILDERLALVYASPKAVHDLNLSGNGGDGQWLDALTDAIRSLSAARPGPITVTGGRNGDVCLGINRYVLSDGQIRYMLTTSEPTIRAKMEGGCRIHDLSAREAEVAYLVSGGLTNESIGAQLGISVRTVENHLRAIFAKVGVNSRTQLVSRLLDIG